MRRSGVRVVQGVLSGCFDMQLAQQRHAVAAKTTLQKNQIDDSENRTKNRNFAKNFEITNKYLETRHSPTVPPASVVGAL